MRVLLAEADGVLRSVLDLELRENGYDVDAVADGEQAAAFLGRYDYEVAIVDWRLDKLSGLEVIERARVQGVRTPVLMLTARDTTADQIAGVNGGADDYLVQPFDLSELLARLLALQRDPAATLGPVLECGDLNFDPATREATIDGVPLALSEAEMRLLELLLRRSPAVVTRRSMAHQVWDDETGTEESSVIDAHLERLSAKLSGSGVQIESVRGSGYRLRTA